MGVPAVPITGNVSRDTAAINDALARDDEIRLAGHYRVDDTLEVAHRDRVRISGSAIVEPVSAGKPVFRFLNVRSCYLDGLHVDGAWRSGVTAIELRGSLFGNVRMTADRVALGADVVSEGAAEQNSAFNEIDLVIYNGIRGMRFSAEGGLRTANNQIRRLVWWGTHSVPSVGMDFEKLSDNNTTHFAYLRIEKPGSTGAVFNSTSPSSDVEVYENHMDRVIFESGQVGNIGLEANRGHDPFRTNITARLSGSSLPQMQVAADANVDFFHNSYLG